MDTNLLWKNFLEKMKEQISSLSYTTWFKDTRLYSIEDSTATIIVPYGLHKKHIMENYKEEMESIFNEITGTNFNLVFKEEAEVNSDNNKISNVIDVNDSVSLGVPRQSLDEANLKPEYTFDTFIVGDSNRFAFTAARAVAEQPGKAYNPLFLYSKSGLGKTHLMQSIGNYILKNSNKRVLYVSSDNFVNDYINAVRTEGKNNVEKIDDFKNKYRNIDVLIIDDIQFLGGATKTQQEFFHTFNSLYNDSKQIIISSDRSPDDLKLLEDRLRTRFCWGLTVNIFPPDFALRMQILRKKIIGGNFEKEISEDVIEYIASNIGTDVRQLEGSITRLIAYSTIMGGAEITLDLAIEALKDFISKGMSEKNDIQRIQKIVSEYFQISVEDIRSKKRSSNISFPRQIAMYLCRSMTNESFPKIGTEFGGKDHSTVMHSVEKIENEIKINKDLANIVEKLKKDIGIV